MPKANNKDKALAALLGTQTIKEAAKRAKLSEPTLYRYLADPEFKLRYREARRQIVEKSISEVQNAMHAAIKTLKRNLSCGNASVEVRAAQIIIDNSIKGVEHLDILERLEVLEYEYQKQG